MESGNLDLNKPEKLTLFLIWTALVLVVGIQVGIYSTEKRVRREAIDSFEKYLAARRTEQ